MDGARGLMRREARWEDTGLGVALEPAWPALGPGARTGARRRTRPNPEREHGFRP
jgi:hypothetical protein